MEQSRCLVSTRLNCGISRSGEMSMAFGIGPKYIVSIVYPTATPNNQSN